MEQQTMGKRIMALRKSKGLTQDQLAEKLGVSAQAVSKWENDVSCPDISLLPQLADILGVSTDELLGARPIEPHVVVVDANDHKQQNKEKDGFSVTYGGNSKEGVWFAVAIILVGLAFILSRTNVLPLDAGITVWGIVWPAVLIGVGVSWFIKNWSPFGLGVGLLGLYFLLSNLGVITFVLSWNLIWPILLVLLGVTILIDKVFPNRHGCPGKGTASSEFNDAAGFVHYDCSFSEETRKVTSETFVGADVDISFGKGILDMTSVNDVRPGAIIKVDVSFGSMELWLPRSIRLEIHSDKAFGAIQMKGEPNADAPFTVQLSGDVSFGNLEVRYI